MREYRLGDLTFGRQYTAELKVISEVGESEFAEELIQVCAEVPAAPPAVTVLSTALDTISLTIPSFDETNSNGAPILSQRIEFSFDGIAWPNWGFEDLIDRTEYNVPCGDQGAPAQEQKVYIRIRAWNLVGGGLASPVVATRCAPPPLQPPAPTVINSGTTWVELSWPEDVTQWLSAGDFRAYKIQYLNRLIAESIEYMPGPGNLDSGGDDSDVSTIEWWHARENYVNLTIERETQTRVNITNLVNNGTYVFRLILVSDVGDGQPSPWLVRSIGPPPPGMSLKVNESDGETAIIAWDVPSNFFAYDTAPTYHIFIAASTRNPAIHYATTQDQRYELDCGFMPDGYRDDGSVKHVDRRMSRNRNLHPDGVFWTQVIAETETGNTSTPETRMACAMPPMALELSEAGSHETRVILQWDLASVEDALRRAPFVAYHFRVFEGLAGPLLREIRLHVQETEMYPLEGLTPRATYLVEFRLESEAGVGDPTHYLVVACGQPKRFASPVRNPTIEGMDARWLDLLWAPPVELGGCAVIAYTIERLANMSDYEMRVWELRTAFGANATTGTELDYAVDMTNSTHDGCPLVEGSLNTTNTSSPNCSLHRDRLANASALTAKYRVTGPGYWRVRAHTAKGSVATPWTKFLMAGLPSPPVNFDQDLRHALVSSIMVSWEPSTIDRSFADADAVDLLGYEVVVDDGLQHDPIRWESGYTCQPERKANYTAKVFAVAIDGYVGDESVGPPDRYCLIDYTPADRWYNVKARTVASSGRSAWAYAVARVGNAPQTAHITPQMATATHASVTFAWTEPPDDRSRTYTYRGELMPADDVNETTGFCACGTWSGVYNASVDPGFNSTCCLANATWSPPVVATPLAPWPPTATVPARLGARYRFRFAARNEFGWSLVSPWSPVATAFGVPATPFDVRQDFNLGERRMVRASFLGPVPGSACAGFSPTVTYEAWTQIDEPGLEDSLCAAARSLRGQANDFVLAATYTPPARDVNETQLASAGPAVPCADAASPALEPVVFAFPECRGAVLNLRIRTRNPSSQTSAFAKEIKYIVAATPDPPLYLRSYTGQAAGQVQLSWVASADSGDVPLSGYEVRATPGAEAWTAVPSTSLAYTFTGLPRTTVQLEVRARNRLGPSTSSTRSHEVT